MKHAYAFNRLTANGESAQISNEASEEWNLAKFKFKSQYAPQSLSAGKSSLKKEKRSSKMMDSFVQRGKKKAKRK